MSAYDPVTLRDNSMAVNSREELLQLLRARTREHAELWVKASVTIRQQESSRKDFFTAIAMYRAPDKIRFGGSRVPIGTLFDVLLDGDRAVIYFNREGSLFVGSIDELAEKAEAIGGLSPRDLVSAVLMQQQLLDVLSSGDPVTVEPTAEHLLVATRRNSGQQCLFMVRRQDGLVEEVLLRDEQGEETLRVRYQEYQLVADQEAREPLPSRMKLEVRSQGVTIDADVVEYRLEPKLNDKAFLPPRAKRTYPMKALQFEASP